MGTCEGTGTGAGSACRLDTQCSQGQRCRKYTDIAIKGDNTWYIDYGANGYYTNPDAPISRWDIVLSGYGDTTETPTPADYDGDGLTDISVKDTNGYWYIDYSSNGFGGWDFQRAGYGYSNAIPVPADYDGDGKADISVKDSTGFWGIDYASNGFNGWDPTGYTWNYGDANSIPVPGDYDGDKKADLATKNQTTGYWDIDYSSDGPGRPILHARLQWNLQLSGYGTATPYAADYDNDGVTDIAEKDSSGTWFIDYAYDGLGSWDYPNTGYHGYGPSSVGTPADYDRDGKTDLSVYDPVVGNWFVDYQANGWGTWDTWPATGTTSITNPTRQLVDTAQPYIATTSVFDSTGSPASVLTIGRRYYVDVAIQPGTDSNNTACTGMANGMACTVSSATQTKGLCRSGACVQTAGIETNPVFNIPPSLQWPWADGFQTVDRVSCSVSSDCVSNDCNGRTHLCNTHRRYNVECSAPGAFVVADRLRNIPVWQNGYTDYSVANADYGVKVLCAAAKTGIYGTVTDKATGSPVPTAQVNVDGISTGVAADGTWPDSTHAAQFASFSGGPHTIAVTDGSNHSSMIATNVQIATSSGFEFNSPLEKHFALPQGVAYTTYVDYIRSRTVYHVVTVPQSASSHFHVRHTNASNVVDCSAYPGANGILCGQPGSTSGSNKYCPQFDSLTSDAASQGAQLAINGLMWEECTGNSLGYIYEGSQLPSFPWCGNGATPQPPAPSTNSCSGGPLFNASDGTPLVPAGAATLFGVRASDGGFAITEGEPNYNQNPSSIWNTTSNGTKIFDANSDGVSDYRVALMMIGNPPLIYQGKVIASGDFRQTTPGDYDYLFPRTAIGTDGALSGSTAYLVVADGEGIHGGGGAMSGDLARFLLKLMCPSVVNACNASAFGLDSGLSSEMVLNDGSGLRAVNTITGEDATIQTVGSYGRGAVGDYILLK